MKEIKQVTGADRAVEREVKEGGVEVEQHLGAVWGNVRRRGGGDGLDAGAKTGKVHPKMWAASVKLTSLVQHGGAKSRRVGGEGDTVWADGSQATEALRPKSKRPSSLGGDGDPRQLGGIQAEEGRQGVVGASRPPGLHGLTALRVVEKPCSRGDDGVAIHAPALSSRWNSS